MNILVISDLWDDQNAEGNTYSNWFFGKEWQDDIFSNFFWRAQQPQNHVCQDYYRVTEIELLRKIFTPCKIGEHFLYCDQSETGICQNNSGSREKKMIAWLHKHPFHVIYAVKEFLQRNVNWRNRRFIQYLEKFNPSIVFGTAGGVGVLPAFVYCIRKHTNAKIVLYLSDDWISRYEKYPWYRRRILIRNYVWGIQHADKLYGATELLCQEYGRKYNVEITPLYKGCQLSEIPQSNNEVVKLVYAGNLFYGRDETLVAFAAALKKCNETVPRAMLEIYTGTPVSDELRKKLDIPGASQIMGQRPYEEIKEILNTADIVLHVESFQQEQIDYVHYSFSTKIIDCLQSGSVTMAIGPAGIASVEYIRNIPGTVVVDDLQKIPDMLGELLEKRDRFPEMTRQSREFAKKNHDIQSVRENLRADFEALLKSDSSYND